MDPVAIGKTLDRCALLRDVSGDARRRLAEMARSRSFAEGETIFRDGDACPGLFVVVEGQVRIYKLAPSGKDHVLHLADPGDTFLEVAVLGGFPCPAFAEALSPTTCLLFPASPLTRALAEDHDLCLQLLRGMAGWVRQLVGLLEDIVLRDATGRLARHLLENARTDGEVVLPSLKRHLASHLNLTSETLSRTLRRLGEAGLIDSGGGRIRIADRDELARVAAGVYPRV